MTHGSQVIDFGWLHLGDQTNQIGRIANVAVVQKELHVLFMSILINMVNSTGIERGCSTNKTMHLAVIKYGVTIKVSLHCRSRQQISVYTKIKSEDGSSSR